MQRLTEPERIDWERRRDEAEARIVDLLSGRAKMQGWVGRDGKLTKSGNRAALEAVMGMAMAADAIGSDLAQWFNVAAFLSASRGVEGRFELKLT